MIQKDFHFEKKVGIREIISIFTIFITIVLFFANISHKQEVQETQIQELLREIRDIKTNYATKELIEARFNHIEKLIENGK